MLVQRGKFMKLSHLVKIIPIAALSGVLLAGCASSNMSQARQLPNHTYEAAKANFDRHNYSAAFVQLQEPAKAGNKHAQYALGYLYFYGLGTSKNISKAKYWFQKASAQGLISAQKALKMM